MLIDFGSARHLLSDRSLTVVESVGYTPFEQLQSRGNIGPWSDLYALGATFVMLMAGASPPKTNDRSFRDPWEPLGGREELKGRFSKAFLAGIDKALRLPIKERWQSAEDWLAVVRGVALPAKLAGEGLSRVMDVSKLAAAELLKRWLWAAVAALALLVGGAMVFWYLQDSAAGGLVICPLRVLRGGSWLTPDAFCRAANRLRVTPVFRSSGLGIRVIVGRAGLRQAVVPE